MAAAANQHLLFLFLPSTYMQSISCLQVDLTFLCNQSMLPFPSWQPPKATLTKCLLAFVPSSLHKPSLPFFQYDYVDPNRYLKQIGTWRRECLFIQCPSNTSSTTYPLSLLFLCTELHLTPGHSERHLPPDLLPKLRLS